MSGQSSFLYRLLSYAPREGRRSAREDFFTEAFAGLLDRDSGLLVALVTELVAQKRLKSGVELLGDGECEIQTQYRCADGRPDLVALVNGSPRFIIESKLGAGFTDSGAGGDGEETTGHQLGRYLREAKQHGAGVALLSLVPRIVPPEIRTHDRYLGNVLWSEVCAFLRSRPCENPKTTTDYLREEVVALMEALGMSPTTPLEKGDAKRYWSYKDLMDRMERLLDAVEVNVRDHYQLEPYRRYDSSYSDCAFRDYTTPAGLRFQLGIRFRQPSDEYLVLYWYVDHAWGLSEKAAEAVGADAEIPGWNGKAAFADDAHLAELHRAASWQHQVAEAVGIYRIWLEKLAKGPLLERRQAAP